MNYQRAFIAFKYIACCQQSIATASRLRCGSVFKIYQPYTFSATRFKSTNTVEVAPQTGFIKKYIKKLGWLDNSKTRLKRSGYFLYETVADKVNYGKFFQELHVWMLMVRLMAEGEEGRFMRNCIVEAMWEDVGTRSKKLGAANPSSVRVQLQELSEQFQAAIIGYDEGLLTDDTVLAGAVWRRFFQQKCDNPEEVECLVRYIRRQVKTLDDLSREQVLLVSDITWPDLQAITSVT